MTECGKRATNTTGHSFEPELRVKFFFPGLDDGGRANEIGA
jgi:hypothetical protein